MRGLQAGARPAPRERRELTSEPAALAADRAAEAWQDLLDRYVDTGRDGRLRVRDQPRRFSAPVALWPLSQVLNAALHVARLHGDTRALPGLVALLETHRGRDGYLPWPGRPPLFYDDNAWVGLAQVQAALVGVEPMGVQPANWEEAARRTLAVVVSGRHPNGAIRWQAVSGSPVNTCASAPAVELALRLALLDPDGVGEDGEDLVATAAGVDGAMTRLLRRDDDLWADHVDQAGRVEHSIWAYNQGTPVGADVLWSRLTADPARLDRAGATARAALAHFGAEDGLWRQPPVFVAILVRNLFALHAQALVPGLLGVVDAYLERAWTEARHARRGTFDGGGIGRYDQGGAIDHAALVQLYALRAWDPGWWPDIC